MMFVTAPTSAAAQQHFWRPHPTFRIVVVPPYIPYGYDNGPQYGYGGYAQHSPPPYPYRGGQNRAIFGSCEHMWGPGYCNMVKSHANSYQSVGGWNIPRYVPPGQ
jgi:hypothetical protein